VTALGRTQVLHHTEGAWFDLLDALRGDPRQVYAVGPLTPPAADWEYFSAGVKAFAGASGLQLYVMLWPLFCSVAKFP
jgi:hypothetical protein